MAERRPGPERSKEKIRTRNCGTDRWTRNPDSRIWGTSLWRRGVREQLALDGRFQLVGVAAERIRRADQFQRAKRVGQTADGEQRPGALERKIRAARNHKRAADRRH